MKLIRIVLLICLCSTQVLAQEEPVAPVEDTRPTKIPELRHSIKADFKLPTPLANFAFTKTVNGIADIAASWQYPVLRFIYLGAGYRYTYWEISDLQGNDKLAASTQFHSPYAVVGYERFASPIFSYSFALKAGYSFMEFYSNTFPSVNGKSKGPGQQAFWFSPEFTLGLMANDNLNFSMNVSYSLFTEEYTAADVGLTSFSGLAASDSEGFYQVFAIGFGFTVYLGGEKKRRSGPKGYGI
jgi:hypothetical protein